MNRLLRRTAAELFVVAAALLVVGVSTEDSHSEAGESVHDETAEASGSDEATELAAGSESAGVSSRRVRAAPRQVGCRRTSTSPEDWLASGFSIAGSAPAWLASGACAVIAMELPGSSWRRRVVSDLSAERQRLVI